MKEYITDLDNSDLDLEILERIRAYRDAKYQSQQAGWVGWIDQEALDYSLRGIEAIRIY